MGREECLLTAQNMDGETPLVVAVINGHTSLASFLLRRHCSVLGLRQSVLHQDTFGFNALHHAIRNGHEDLALEMVREEFALSQAVSNCNESPLYAATLRNFTQVIEKLLNIQDSSHAGPNGCKALHAAVRTGFTESAAIIMRIKPEMARVIDNDFNTPMSLAVLYNRIDVLQVLLQHDCSLGTWLHTAVSRDDAEFVEFILRTPHLGRVINMQENDGRTALHVAVINYNPRIVAALLSHEDIDVTVQNFQGNSAAWELWNNTDEAKTLNWNEVCMLMAKADPQGASALQSLHTEAKQRATKKSRTDAKSLTQTYTRNTSLVAILIAAITFAAAFTLPGGYGSAPGSEGLPIMSQKVLLHEHENLAMVVAFSTLIQGGKDDQSILGARLDNQWRLPSGGLDPSVAVPCYATPSPHRPWPGVAVRGLSAGPKPGRMPVLGDGWIRL
uniref:Uncharacterized protein n=1 Tax=Avena sativa TaxID=4498 RepID=A0ACD5XGS4_AVESA